MHTTVASMTFKTFDEMVSAANRAGDEKWQRYPFEDALDAVLGYTLVRDDGKGGEEEYRLLWHPFGSLASDMTFIEREFSARIPDVLQSFTGTRTVKYDDPKSRYLGFVHYNTPGYATGMQFGLMAIKELGPKTFTVGGVDFMDWRNSLPSLAKLTGVAGKYGF